MPARSGARPPVPAKAVPAKVAAPEQQREPVPPAAPAEPEPPVHRAGGWIDRGDGRGWELEE